MARLPLPLSHCVWKFFWSLISAFSPILQGNLQIHHVGQDGQVSAHMRSLNASLPWVSPDLALLRGGVGSRMLVRHQPRGQASASPAATDVLEHVDTCTGGALGYMCGFVGCDVVFCFVEEHPSL